MEEKRGFLERGLTARAFIFGIILSIICAIIGTATCYRGEYQYSSLINLAKIATWHEFDHIFLRIAYVALLPAFITALLPKGLRFSEAELVVIYSMIATVVPMYSIGIMASHLSLFVPFIIALIMKLLTIRVGGVKLYEEKGVPVQLD
ncbi:hypothetical protein DRO64_06860 [Candidatus Bathyarchaeota archaeon]|nr:MAG: hypothetical protein DRO64_06860 [Candidatus Bathyarchaeota archaeon]